MQLSGEEVFSQPPDILWDRLVDLRFAANAIPGLERIERSEADLLVCHVRPPLSFLSGKIKLTMVVLEKNPTTRARMRMEAKGIGAGLVVETNTVLSPHEEGTKLAWSGEVVQRSGLLRTISPSLIEAAARKIIADSWAGFRAAQEM